MALRERASLVELGSYCGKSTLAIALTLQALDPGNVAFHTVDPHDGYEFAQGVDTYGSLLETLARNGVSDRVVVVRASSRELKWNEPVALLFLDALHDYESVRDDYARFAPWLVPDGFVAFHDHSAAFPGVMRIVRELTESGELALAGHRDGLVALRRLPDVRSA